MVHCSCLLFCFHVLYDIENPLQQARHQSLEPNNDLDVSFNFKSICVVCKATLSPLGCIAARVNAVIVPNKHKRPKTLPPPLRVRAAQVSPLLDLLLGAH